ncbi:MAG: SDR family oxidoreductase [Gammaproteobacteria bacterium]|nr:SDR family oxidoreductase [Gammaproteobacteria bacterium]
MQQTDQPVALITGGAVRLGRIISLALAKKGYRLIVHYNSSEQEANSLAKELDELSVDFTLVKADLSKSSGVQQLVEQLPPNFQQVNTLINSAAVFPDDDHWGQCESSWDSIINVNARAPIVLAERLFTPNSLRTSTARNIINILDARVSRNQSERLVYRWSKALLWQATQDLALKLAPQVRVNGIALGAMLPPPGCDDLHMRRLKQSIPLRQTGSTEDLIKALDYLITQTFVTGEVLRLDGGEFL